MIYKTYKTHADLKNALEAPFPIEAYKIDGSRGFDLTSLNAQYIKDRLNDVFGIDGWHFEEQFTNLTEQKEIEISTKEKKKTIKTKSGIICHGKLIVEFLVEEGNEELRVARKFIFATGGCEYREYGQTISDIFKSAATEALSKASSFLGIGGEMYKGEIDPKMLEMPRGKVDRAINAIKSAQNKEDLAQIELEIEKRKWEQKEIEDLKEAIELAYKTFGKNK